MNTRTGICYLVGAGPGDPGLMTVRGMACLRSAERVFIDRLVNPALLRELSPDAQWRYVGKDPRGPSVAQKDICALLVEATRAGYRVVRLKGGDPFVFGRGGEEVEALSRAGLRFEIVPGITAGIAAPAYAGIPVTHRGLSGQVTFVNGHMSIGAHTPPVDWPALARLKHTLCIYMGVTRVGEICRALIDGGRAPATSAAAIRNATLPTQQCLISTLAELPAAIETAGLQSPAMIVVGETVALHDTCAWFRPDTETAPWEGDAPMTERPESQPFVEPPEEADTSMNTARRSGTIPVFLKLDNRPCLLIGGGAVATRKLAWLLEAGAHVQLMAPEICPDIRAITVGNKDRVTLVERAYAVECDDITGYAMVFVACGQPHVNEAVSRRARALGIPVNVADVPHLCTFYVPGTIRRGSLCVAIGTNGDCPALAGRLRRELSDSLPEWLGDFTEALRRVREWLLTNEPHEARRMAVMKHLAAPDSAKEIMVLTTADMEQRLRTEAKRFLRDQA